MNLNIKAMAMAVLKKAAERSPEILAGTAVVGVGVTAVLTFRGTPRALELKAQREVRTDEDGEMCETKPETFARDALAMAPALAPAVASGVLTAACIVAGNRIQARHIGVLASAYALSEAALSDYQERVISKVGEDAHAAIMEEVAIKRQERASASESGECPFDGDHVVGDDGLTLCYDAVTGRYFKSSIERIRMAEGIVSKMMLQEQVASVNDFYEALLADQIDGGIFDAVGWAASDPNGLNVYFTSMLDPQKRPCLVLNYNVHLLDRGYFR